jgi:hypothetical protein
MGPTPYTNVVLDVSLRVTRPRHGTLVRLQKICDLILRRPPSWAAVSKDGTTGPGLAAILRDARKSALLRMRSELFHTVSG